MQVPVIDQQSIFTQGEIAPASGPALARAPTGIGAAAGVLSRGLEAVGRTYDQMATEEARRDKEEKEEAAKMVAAKAEYDLQKQLYLKMYGSASGGGTQVPNDLKARAAGWAFERQNQKADAFLATQGQDALELSGELIAEGEKERERIAATIQDPKTREKYEARSYEILAQYTRQVEQHAFAEAQKADEATAKGLQQLHIGQSEAGVANYDEWVSGGRRVEDEIRRRAPSKEAGDAEVQDFRSRDAAAFVEGLLAQGRIDDAKEFAQAQKSALGTRFGETAKTIESRAQNGEKDRVNAEVAGIVAKWTDSARDANGFVTEDALRQKFRDLPPEDPRRDELQASFEKATRLERERLDAASKKYAGQAELAALVDGRPIPAEAEAHLRKYDPSALVSIREKQRASFRRWKTEKDGSASERAAARREQSDADKVFLNELETELTNNPATDPKDFEKKWVARRVDEGEDVTAPSDVARSKAGLSASKAVKRDEKAETTERKQVAARLERTISAATKVQGKPLDQTQLNERVGRALSMYDQRSAEKGGRALDEKDLAALEADLMRSVVTEPGWLGTSIGQKRKLGVDVGAGTPPAPNRLTLPEQTITTPDSQQAAAKAWLDANPDDPRAPAVRRKLGL